MKPTLGAAPDPYRISIPPHSKPATLARLASTFPPASLSENGPFSAATYAPVLRSLHAHYCSALHAVLAPFAPDPSDLAYVAAARWPGFVQPVLEEHWRRVQELSDDAAENAEVDEAELELEPPDEETRVRLLRHFTPTFTAALDALYPRHAHAAAWALAHPFGTDPSAAATSDGRAENVKELTRLGKFVLLAAYCASTNPAKSDLRMFGRLDDGSRRRKKGGGTRKTRAGVGSGKVKVCSCLSSHFSFFGELTRCMRHRCHSACSAQPHSRLTGLQPSLECSWRSMTQTFAQRRPFYTRYPARKRRSSSSV